jgi:hypothetical protein
LQQVELVEVHTLLERVIAGDLHVGLLPEVGQVLFCARRRASKPAAAALASVSLLRHISSFAS